MSKDTRDVLFLIILLLALEFLPEAAAALGLGALAL